jgi:hypothetical protein
VKHDDVNRWPDAAMSHPAARGQWDRSSLDRLDERAPVLDRSLRDSIHSNPSENRVRGEREPKVHSCTGVSLAIRTIAESVSRSAPSTLGSGTEIGEAPSGSNTNRFAHNKLERSIPPLLPSRPVRRTLFPYVTNNVLMYGFPHSSIVTRVVQRDSAPQPGPRVQITLSDREACHVWI